jgi:hypothetical protein
MDSGVNRKFETGPTFDPHVFIKKTVGLFLKWRMKWRK